MKNRHKYGHLNVGNWCHMRRRFVCDRDCCCDQNGIEMCHEEGQALLDEGLIQVNPSTGVSMSGHTPRIPPCAYCGKRVPGLERDHVVPRSRGGPDNATNIVMACKSCNSSKGDLTPSEWLGDRCPGGVLKIEQRINERLAADFSKRDNGPKVRRPYVNGGPSRKPIYAIHLAKKNRGKEEACYFGEVVEERDETIRIDTYSALDGGPYGELIDVPRASCRLFSCQERMVLVLRQLTENHLRRIRRRGAIKLLSDLSGKNGRTKHRNVHVFWDHDHDERILKFIDDLPSHIAASLIATLESKGGIWLVWRDNVPSGYAEDEQVEVSTGCDENGEEYGDVWNINSSVAV